MAVRAQNVFQRRSLDFRRKGAEGLLYVAPRVPPQKADTAGREHNGGAHGHGGDEAGRDTVPPPVKSSPVPRRRTAERVSPMSSQDSQDAADTMPDSLHHVRSTASLRGRGGSAPSLGGGRGAGTRGSPHSSGRRSVGVVFRTPDKTALATVAYDLTAYEAEVRRGVVHAQRTQSRMHAHEHSSRLRSRTSSEGGAPRLTRRGSFPNQNLVVSLAGASHRQGTQGAQNQHEVGRLHAPCTRCRACSPSLV